MSSPREISSDDRLGDLLAAYDEARTSGAGRQTFEESLSTLPEEELRQFRHVQETLETLRFVISPYPDQQAHGPLFEAHHFLGRFEIIKELGRGGFGVVFLAKDSQLKRDVALKVARAESLFSEERNQRFEREARAAARLKHPGIAAVFESGTDGATTFIVSEYCTGGTLSSWMRNASGRLSPAAAARVALELAQALDHAHQRGILHRDIKPSNILLDPKGVVEPGDPFPYLTKLTDFGLAKIMDESSDQTRTGAIIGTPKYMSPEQASGRIHDIGISTDVYAVGLVLYELLVGHVPFDGDTDIKLLQRIALDDPPPIRSVSRDCPLDLETICLKCLEKEPGRRYRSASELADDLSRFLANEPISARRLSPTERLWKWVRRRPVHAAAAALAILFPITVLIQSLWMNASLWRANTEIQAQRDMVAQSERDLRLRLHHSDLRRAAESLEKRQFSEAQSILSSYLPTSDREDIRTSAWSFLWNQAAARAPKEHKLHSSDIYCIDLSADGRRLATASRDGTAVIWELPSFNRLHTLTGHQQMVNVALFSPDDSLIATTSDDATVRLWDTQTGQQLALLKGHEDEINAAAFSPDGSRLVTGGVDTRICLWDVAERKLATEPRSVDGTVLAVGFAPDGQTIVTADYSGALIAWDAELQTMKWKRTADDGGFGIRVSSLTFATYDGDVHVAGQYGQVQNAALDTGKLGTMRRTESEQHILGSALSPDEKFLVTCEADGSVHSFELHTDDPPTTLLASGRHRAWTLAFGPVMGQLLVGTSQGNLLDVNIPQVQLEEATRLATANECFLTIETTDDPAEILVAGGRNISRIDPISHVVKQRTITDQNIWCGSLHPDGKTLATGTTSGSVELFNAENLAHIATIEVPPLGKPHQSRRAGAVEYSPSGRYLAVTIIRPGQIALIEASTQSLLFNEPLPGVGEQIHWINDREFIVLAADVRRYAIEDDRCKLIWSTQHVPIPISLTPDGDNAFLIFSRLGGIYRLSGDSVTDVCLKRFPQTFCSTASRDGRWLAIGTPDAVHILDRSSLQTIRIVLSHQTEVLKLEFSLDGEFLFVGANDNQLSKIHRQDKTPNLSLQSQGGAERFIVSPDGRWEISTHLDGIAVVDTTIGQVVPSTEWKDAQDAAFSTDGRWLALALDSGIRVMTAKDLTLVGDRPDVMRSPIEAIRAIGDGRWLLVAANEPVRLLDFHTGKTQELPESTVKEIKGVNVSADGTQIAIFDTIQRLRLWDLKVQSILSLPRILSSDVTAMTWWTSHGQVLVGTRHGIIEFWDADGDAPTREIRLPTDRQVTSLLVAPDDATLIVADNTEWLQFVDLKTGELVYRYPVDMWACTLGLSPAKDQLLSRGTQSNFVVTHSFPLSAPNDSETQSATRPTTGNIGKK